MLSYANTTEMKEIASRLNILINEYNSLINSLFIRLAKVPYETNEWVGNTAEYYFRTIELDKAEFLNFGMLLATYSAKIKNDASLIEETITKNLNIERGN